MVIISCFLEINQSITFSCFIHFTDYNNLFAPARRVHGDFYSTIQGSNVTLECIPTISNTSVTLWRRHSFGSEMNGIRVNETTRMSYDPMNGFKFIAPNWSYYDKWLKCKFQYEDTIMYQYITIDYLTPSQTLLPQIVTGDDNAFIQGSNISLKCFVKVIPRIPVILLWHYPKHVNFKNNGRFKALGNVVTNEPNGIITFSIAITIYNVNINDSGVYQCKVSQAYITNYTTYNVKIFPLSSIQKEPQEQFLGSNFPFNAVYNWLIGNYQQILSFLKKGNQSQQDEKLYSH
jgi:hypothetical protein